ncbi:MAG TPA: DUF2834 domain-containing protein [Trichocoleus sp.]
MTTASTTVAKQNFRLSYLVLAIPGALLPWAFLLDFLLGPNPSEASFFAQAFANPVATALACDLLVSALVFWVFAFEQLRRQQRQQELWLYIVLTLAVGLSFALPIFLFRTQISRP